MTCVDCGGPVWGKHSIRCGRCVDIKTIQRRLRRRGERFTYAVIPLYEHEEELIDQYALEIAATYEDPPPHQVDAIHDYVRYMFQGWIFKGKTAEEIHTWHARSLARHEQERQTRALRQGKRTLRAIRKVLRDQPNSRRSASARARILRTL